MFPSFGPGHVGIRVNLDEGLKLAQRHGFKGLDFDMNEAYQISVDKGVGTVRDMFKRTEMLPGTWNLPFHPMGEEELWRKGIEKLKGQAEFGAKLESLRVSMWIIPGSNTLTFKENFDFHVKRYSPIAAALKAHGARLGLEFVGPLNSRKNNKYEFVYNLPGMLELCAAIGDNVGLLLDSWHWYTSGGTLEDLRKVKNKNLVHIHMNDAPTGVAREEQIDNKRKLPGTTGVIDMKGFLLALKGAKYDGPLTAEPFDQEISKLPPEESAAATAKAMFSVLEGI